MKKIILLCAAGMSTSMLVKKMQEAAAAENFECEIAAYPTAEALIKEGDEVFVEGHNAHASLLQQEAEGGPGSTLSLLILHAEDQLMSAEGFKTIAQEFIEVYKKFKELGK